MAAEIKREVKLEIVHVLFLDIVGYSKALTDEQQELIDRLNQVVRGSEEFQKAASADRLIKIPTGDGMALIFYNSPEQPVNCALEISRALRNSSDLPVRMGVHSGPVSAVTDLNDRVNAAGMGINVAQRVMDCGDTGHILLSKRVAEDLQQYSRWRSHLHDLGEVEAKHGERVYIFNFYTEQAGTPDLPRKIGDAKPNYRASRPPPTNKAPKTQRPSICVLPFANMSGDPEQEYFSDGISEDIITDLSKISALHVVSRNTAFTFKGKEADVGQVASHLKVSHVVEGSVRKSAGRVRITAPLIDGVNDSDLRAERALALNPDLAEAHAVKARILSEENRYDEANREIDIALQLDSESYQVNRAAGFLRFIQKQIKEAAAYWEKVLTLEESDFGVAGMLITVYTALGRHEAAQRAAKITLERCEKILARDSNNAAALGHSGAALAVLGQHERAKEWMERALLVDPDNITMRYNVVCALANDFKDKDAALEMLRPAFERMGTGMINHAKVDPDLDPIRDDPRFKEMLAAAERRLSTSG